MLGIEYTVQGEDGQKMAQAILFIQTSTQDASHPLPPPPFSTNPLKYINTVLISSIYPKSAVLLCDHLYYSATMYKDKKWRTDEEYLRARPQPFLSSLNPVWDIN